MKIVFLSDTHEQHNDIPLPLPDGDILIHSGDWTFKGSAGAIDSFFTWFSAQPHKYKICIAGNHELSLNGVNRDKMLALIKSYTDKNANLHYLENNGVSIDGINFWGSPASPFFHAWAFNYMRGKDIAMVWSKIPLDTNVLITHGPPMGILDEAPRGFGEIEHVGCEELLKRIDELPKLKIHAFGHIHPSAGVFEKNGVKFVNGSTCNEKYNPTNVPIVIEI